MLRVPLRFWPRPRRSRTTTRAVLDYLIEYTRAHLSPVIARGLRMYRERGLSALAEELKITKAPRKTLAASSSSRWSATAKSR